MKKILALLLVLALLSLTIGCQQLAPPVPYSEPTAESSDVKDIDNSINTVEDKDLDMSDLESLESDLDQI